MDLTDLATIGSSGSDNVVIALVVAVVVAGLAVVLLFVSALFSVLGSRLLSGTGKLMWIIGVLCFPFLGPLTWFLWGRDHSPGAR